MRRITLHLPVLLVGIILAADQKLPAAQGTFTFERVEFMGRHTLTAESVINVLQAKRDEKMGDDGWKRMVENLLDFYRSRGFLRVRVKVYKEGTSEGHSNLIIKIQEGPRARFGGIEVTGNGLFSSDEIEKCFGLSPGETVDADLLKQSLLKVENKYLDAGYAAVKVYPSNLRLGQDGRLYFRLNIREGPRFKVGRFVIEGLEGSSRSLVVLVSGIKPGMVYSRRKLELARRRISNCGYFSRVDSFRVKIDRGRNLVDLKLRAEEGPRGTFSGIVGYHSPNNGGRGELVGSLNVKLFNISGSGRYGGLAWQNLAAGSSRLEIYLGEPYLFKKNMGLEARVYQALKDGLFLRREFFLKAEILRNFPYRWFLSLRKNWVWPNRSAEIFPRANSWSLGSGLDAEFPGWSGLTESRCKFSGAIELGRRAAYGEMTTRYGRVQGDLNIGYPLRSDRSILLGFHLRRILFKPELTLPGERFLLGGGSSLRGFREASLCAWEALWLNLEYRFKTVGGLTMFPFIDVARLRPEISGKPVHLSYGMGIRLRTRAGILGCDYALIPGRTLGQGLVHLRLAQEFR